jgi:DNA-binding MarR family transcriptional regulator
MATTWLSPSEMRAWRSFIGTVSDLSAALEADIVREGVGLGDYQVLVFLSEAPSHSMRMCDLAQHLQLSPSGLTRRLDGLVKAGAVERQASHDDRRVMMAVLTEPGFATLERVAPHHVASVRRRILDRLDTTQVAALESIFAAIGEGLKTDSSCPKNTMLTGASPAHA